MTHISIKPGWKTVKFGDVVRQVKDRVDPKESGLTRYIAGEHMTTDDLRLRRWGDIDDGYLGPAFHMRFKPGQVLYGSRRTYLRKVAVADFEGICANTTYVLETKDPNVLLPELLPFIMTTESFHEHSIQQSKGSVNPYINFSDITWYEFPLPPLDEQLQIANLLQEAIAVVVSLDELVEKYDLLHWSLVDNLLKPNDGYKSRKLKEICGRITVGIASSASHAYRSSGVPMIRNTDVNAGYISRNDMPFLDLAFDEKYRKKRVRTGDVVTARTGKPGISAVVPSDLNNAQTFTTLIISPNPDELDSNYLCWWLNSSHGQRYVLTRKAGGIQQNLNATLLKEMPLMLPTIEEQKQIISKILDSIAVQKSISLKQENAKSFLKHIREISLTGRM